MRFNRLIIEEINKYVNNIICESQESKSQAKAKKLAMENGLSPEHAEQFVRVDLRNDITSLRNRNAAKFTLGCARLFFEKQLIDAESINMLNNIIGLIANKYIDKFDQNLNGLNLNELNNQFSGELEEIEQQNRNGVNSKTYENKDYEIVPINSFEEAQQYSKYTDIGEKYHWCLTYMKSMWDNYTKDGNNQVYFCLKNGFENIKPNPTGDPMDEYGLSMISVIVDKDGNLAYCTLRWNHGNNAKGDNALTVQELSDIVGVNFYETFKPNNKWEELISEIKQRLANGEDPHDIFDECGEFYDGLAVIKLKNKWNYIGTNGKLLSDQWLDKVDTFNNGFAIIKLNGKSNWINTNGKLLSDQWFDKCYYFGDNGFAMIKLNNKYNFIDTNGKLLSDQWFDETCNFTDGFALIGLNGKSNWIDTNGKLLSDQWFNIAYTFREGFAGVYINGKGWNFIDKNIKYLSNQWFDDISNFRNSFARVQLNDKWNYIDKNCNYLSDQWFDNCGYFNNGLAKVKLNGKNYHIDTHGNLHDKIE